jgi:hypothetical protein
MLSLQSFVLAILTGSIGLGPALYLGFERIPFLTKLDPETKRWAVAGVAGALGVLLALLGRYMGFLDMPFATGQDIINAIWNYGVLLGLSAFTSSQMVHGRLAMNRKD